MGDQRDIYFYVINENPVELRLRGWGSNLTRSAVELMGVEEGNVTTIRNRNNMTYASKSVSIGSFAGSKRDIFKIRESKFMVSEGSCIFQICT